MFKNRTLLLKIAGRRTINRNLTTSCAASYDCQGPILGHKYVRWLVSASCLLGCSHVTSSVFGTQYSLPCTEWLRSRPFGLLGRSLFIFSHSQKISCPFKVQSHGAYDRLRPVCDLCKTSRAR